MVGDVTTWYMTESERLAYIAKHPIIPTEKPKGASFSNVNTLAMKKDKKRVVPHKESVMDKYDNDDIQRRFVAGDSIRVIAEAVGVNYHTLDKYIQEQRKIEPDKWPSRVKR